MTMRKGILGLKSWGGVLAVLAFLAGVGSHIAKPTEADAGGDWKNILMVFTTDIKGHIEPCG